MAHQKPTAVVAILGGDSSVVDNVVALLLEGCGYNTKLLEASAPALADGRLVSVDPLLLSSDSSSRVRNTLLSGVRANPKTAPRPVLTLSTADKERLSTRTTPVVPWPTPLEDLRRAVEAALTPASQRLLAEGEG